MADDPHNTSDVSDPVGAGSAKEDAETTAARRELKQTSISEKAGHADSPLDEDEDDDDDRSGSDEDDNNKNNNAREKTAAAAAATTTTTTTTTTTQREATPDTDPGDARENNDDDDMLREQVSSPKKKRAHDELVADGSSTTAGEGSSKPVNTAVAQSRTEESEPEKKRPRDRESATRRRSQDGAESGGSSRSSLDKTSEAKDLSGAIKGANGNKPQTTSFSAFASSGFAKLAASSTSPFGTFGGAGKPSLFGAPLGSPSGSFSVLGGPKPNSAAPTLSFGGASSSTAPKLGFGGVSSTPKLSFGGASSSASPFALNGAKSGSSVFGGSPFSSTFGGGTLSGQPRLTTFGKPGTALKSDKPARPFGAPESDAEEGSEKEDGDEEDETKSGEAGSDEESKEADKDKDKEESKALAEEKRRVRLQKIVVDDGESGEATLLAVRAKMYQMEKGVGWKERGAGMLKINVPKVCVELDDFGNPDPTTFDASVLEEDDDDDDGDEGGGPKNVRLIMRQDHTLRVILNTIVLPAMTFKLTQKLKAAYVLFTAFEGGEPKQVQMKLSEANATLFTQLMEMIRKQLSDV